jgi:hypothetical protein
MKMKQRGTGIRQARRSNVPRVCALAAALFGTGAQAMNFDAASEADLIAAINKANAHVGTDQIRITHDIVLHGALPAITDPLTIRGIGLPYAIRRNDTGANACSPTAANAFRLLDASADLTLVNLKLSGGCNLVDSGGAVRVQHAALLLKNSTVTGNQTFVDNPNYYYQQGIGGGVAVLYGSLTLVDSTVSGNATHGNVGGGGGAAAFVSDLHVVHSTISGNQTNGGYAYGGGAYAAGGTVTVSDSVFSNNSSSGEQAHGGGLWTYSLTSTIVDSVFSGNSSGGGSGNRGAGLNIMSVPNTTTTTSIDRCTISNNSITSYSGWGAGVRVGGGAIRITSSSISDNRIEAVDKARGGGMWIEHADATLTNTTVSGNEASGSEVGSGGISVDSEAPDTMSLSIYNSTIAGNRGLGGTGGIWLQRENHAATPPLLTLESTIVAGNTGQNGFDEIGFGYTHDPVPEPASPVVVANHSLIQGNVDVGAEGTYTPDATTVALAGLDPLLGPLSDNGGPTWTLALDPASPAIDQGTNVAEQPFDQRGNGYPRKIGPGVDIGAYELKPGHQ